LDTVRVFAKSAIIDGVIEGDLLIFAAILEISENARITGNVLAYSGSMTMDGTIDGKLQSTAGEIHLNGTVAGNTDVEVDTIKLGPEARIQGDLIYSSRRLLEMADGATIDGETIFNEKVDEEEDEGWSKFGIFWWLWTTTSAVVVGLVLVAIFSRLLPTMAATITKDPLIGLLVGFGAFLVVPAASFVALVFLPLGITGLLLYLIALYLAKIPVATWLGDRLLSLSGRKPSPYLSVVVGVVLLQLLFLVPYLGTLAWLVTFWLGLGAMILATRNRLHPQQPTPA